MMRWLMSQLLQSLLEEVGDPDREDMSAIIPLVQARIRSLPRDEQHQLLDEVSHIRGTLCREDRAVWLAHQILFQLLWHELAIPVPLTEEQRALQRQIQADYAEGNG